MLTGEFFAMTVLPELFPNGIIIKTGKRGYVKFVSKRRRFSGFQSGTNFSKRLFTLLKNTVQVYQIWILIVI